jgi:hypothetical protein
MNEPTEANFATARDLLFPELANELPHNIARLQFSDESQGQIQRVAQGLASAHAARRQSSCDPHCETCSCFGAPPIASDDQ